MKKRNLDMLRQQKAEIANKLHQALQSENPEEFSQAFEEFTGNLEQLVMAEAEGMIQSIDANILQGRGARQLTSEENKYYEQVIEAMQSTNPQQALTELDVVMPKTVIDTVFEDLTTSHPLLEAISFTNTSNLTEFLMNKNGHQLAAWGELNAEIIKELTSAFKKVNLTLFKLSAFLPVSKPMLDLGPAWLDRYVRAILGEALANGLEEAIVNGTGKNMPIGMNRQVGEGVNKLDDVSPLKETVEMSSLDPATYGALLSTMALGPNDKIRKIASVIMIVNPVDYLNKIMPATTVRGADGRYVNDVLPFPTKIIESVAVPVGKAIVGLAKRYFMGIGTSKSGKLEHDDSYRFLEDQRIYLVKLYGYGEPMDNNAFKYLDISNMKAATLQVQVIGEDGEPADTILVTSDARASNITIGAAVLDPVFNKSTHQYNVETTNATNVINVTPIDAEAVITIMVSNSSNTEVNNGDPIAWDEGLNTVTVNISSGGDHEVYTFLVTKTA